MCCRPLPARDDDRQAVVTDTFHVEQECVEALQTFRVSLAGTARRHRDDAAALRDEDGAPVGIAIELEWRTDGVPYAWRQSTRYEIPCRVTGSVRIGDEIVELTAREFAILEVFLRNPDRVISREQLLNHVWGYNFDPGSNVVDVYVRALRGKIGSSRIETIRGAGYRLP